MNDIINIYDWFSGNSLDDTDTNKFKIHIFGKNKFGKSCCIIVDNFTPFIYLKYPQYWDKSKVKKILGNLNKKYFKSNNKQVKFSFSIVKRKIFRGFTNDKKFNIIRVTFENTYDMRNFIAVFEDRSTLIEVIKKNNEKIKGYTKYRNYQNLQTIKVASNGLEYEIDMLDVSKINTIKNRVEPKKNLNIKGLGSNEKLELYESNIDPLLRFLHIQNLSPSCCVTIPSSCKKTIPEISNCDIEYEVNWKNINICQDNTMKFVTQHKILLFDIECNSHHGDFPLAKKDWSKLVKDIIKITHKCDLDKDKLEMILKTIPNREIDGVNKIYIKHKYKKYYASIDKKNIIDEIIIIIYLTKKLLEVLKNKNSILIETSELEDLFQIRLPDDIEKINKYIKIFEKASISVLEKELYGDKIDKYSLSYDSTKNPITYTEEYLTITFNEYFSRDPVTDNKILRPDEISIIQGDEIIQIGSCLVLSGEKECYKKHIITLDTCDNFDNSSEIVSYVPKQENIDNEDNKEIEKKVLLEWKNLIMEEDPDMITGFNIFNFDIPYLFERAQELDIYDEFSELSRLQDKICHLREKGGKLNTKFVDIPGRVQFDIYKIVKEMSLDSYKLDFVSSHFIRGKIKSFSIEDNETKITVDNTVGLKIGNYIKISKIGGYDEIKYKEGKKLLITQVSKNQITVDDKIDLRDTENLVWTLGKDDISAKQIFQYQKEDSYKRSLIAKYCIMDVVLCVELMNKLQLIPNNIGMSNVCTTPLSWIFTRGQGIKILSLLSKECRLRNYILPTLYPDTFDNSGYEGACVLNPNAGIYFRPIVTLDYASLYPNSMCAENMSHETLVNNAEYLGDKGKEKLKELGYECNDISYQNFKYNKDKKIPTGETTVRFVKKTSGEIGIVPTILKHLLKQRKLTRDRIKYKIITLKNGDKYTGIVKKNDDGEIHIKLENEPELTIITKHEINTITDYYNAFEKINQDGFQLAYKITANSLYGQIGAKTSQIYWKEIAASTTATGRKQLYIAKEFVEKEMNGKVVYGDTDSVFVDFNIKSDKETREERIEDSVRQAIKLGKEAADRISKILKKPQDLEYEKVFQPFALISKKKYVGNKYEEDPKKYKQTSMGIVLKRRDNAPILKLIYGTIIDKIMKDMNIKSAIDYLRLSLRQVINGKYDLEKFVVTKTLNDNYKNPDMIAHNVLAERIARRTGKKPQIGDRIGYIYIETKNEHCLQGEKIETIQYILDNNLNPDYYFYITNQIMKPVCQIFSLELENIKGFQYNKDFYVNMRNNEKAKNLTDEKINDKIRKHRQNLTENILFYDIQRYYQNKKNNTNEITKWFKTKK